MAKFEKEVIPDNAALGKNIRKKRLEKNISQEYLAEKLDISRQSISKWENGLSEPSKRNLAQLARIFDCELEELLYGTQGLIEKDGMIVVGVAVLNNDIDRLKQFFQEMPSDIYDCYRVSFVIALDNAATKAEKFQAVDKIRQYSGRSVVPIDLENDEIVPHCIFVTEQESNGGGFDCFFRLLAEEYGKNTAAVLMSGKSGNVYGISLIKKAGGLTILCELERRLPNQDIWNAAGSSAFNHVLEPEVMGYWLAADENALALMDEKYYMQVIKALKKKTELPLEDFKEGYVISGFMECMKYRQSTPPPDFYVKYLEESEEEQENLLKSIMKYARRNAPGIAGLLELKGVLPEISEESSEIRIWVADCGNGLEVYAIAMMLADNTKLNVKYDNVKIFATDMREEIIASAIKGRYDDSELEEIPEQWKKKYFQRDGDSWLIRQKIRNKVIFSVHDVITNPPFARLDLVVCRNAMNIFRIRGRRNIIKRFSFALKQNGLLMLGDRQDIREVFRWFSVLEGHKNVYKKERGVSFLKPVYAEKESFTAGKVIEELFAASMPSCIIIDERYEIIYTGKNGGRYLGFKTGEFSKNLFDNIDREIGIHINAIIRKLKKEDDETTESVRLKKSSFSLTIHVLRKFISEADYYLIWFEEDKDTVHTVKCEDQEKAELERELKVTQESLMQALEELESVRSKYEISNEKLQSTNEELVVINDELQVANGELEATNRKLTRVNGELMEANTKLAKTNWRAALTSRLPSQIRELYKLLDMEIIYLDCEFCIKKFTRGIPELTDIGEQDLEQNILDLLPEEDCAVWTANFKKAEHGERVFRRVKNKGRNLMVEILPYKNKGTLNGYIVLIQKIQR